MTPDATRKRLNPIEQCPGFEDFTVLPAWHLIGPIPTLALFPCTIHLPAATAADTSAGMLNKDETSPQIPF
jgi:hypothetical protein